MSTRQTQDFWEAAIIKTCWSQRLFLFCTQDELLRSEISHLKSRLSQQERMLTGAVKRLRSTNHLKEGMERVIIDQRKILHTHSHSYRCDIRALMFALCVSCSVSDLRCAEEGQRKPGGLFIIHYIQPLSWHLLYRIKGVIWSEHVLLRKWKSKCSHRPA